MFDRVLQIATNAKTIWNKWLLPVKSFHYHYVFTYSDTGESSSDVDNVQWWRKGWNIIEIDFRNITCEFNKSHNRQNWCSYFKNHPIIHIQVHQWKGITHVIVLYSKVLIPQFLAQRWKKTLTNRNVAKPSSLTANVMCFEWKPPWMRFEMFLVWVRFGSRVVK